MAKKGFKLPPPTPLKQTAGNSFFTNLPMRDYGTSGPYANPQTYFGESSLGANVVSTIGNTFADSINAAASSQNTDSSVDTDVSGSNLTIDPTGNQEGQNTNVEGLEKGEDPKLEARIIKAKNEGNLKKAARLQGKQDRKKVRQVEGAERIKERQDDRTQRVTDRQEGLTKDFEDKNFAGRMLSSIGNIFRSPTTMKEESPLGFVPGQQMGQPQAFSYDVPTQANMMGTAKPLFNQQTMGMAEAAFGNPAMRQASVGAAFQMKTIPEGDEGKGLRSLPDNVVEKMGYDSATKMLSPLDQRSTTVLGVEYSLSPELYSDSLRLAKKEQKFNESMKPKPTKTLINKHDINPKFAPPNNTNVQNNKKELFKKNK